MRNNRIPRGITSLEAARHLQELGPNELTEEKTSATLQFLSFF